MFILQIEHKVPSYAGWKKAFDSDPIGREKSGVKHFLIFRQQDDQDYVIVHLGFDTLSQAENTLKSLQQLWQKVEGSVMVNPKTRILEIVDAVDL